jgi:hypothetical protein
MDSRLSRPVAHQLADMRRTSVVGSQGRGDARSAVLASLSRDGRSVCASQSQGVLVLLGWFVKLMTAMLVDGPGQQLGPRDKSALLLPSPPPLLSLPLPPFTYQNTTYARGP